MCQEYDTDEVCLRCDSCFEDYDSISHTLQCLAFYDAVMGGKARRMITHFDESEIGLTGAQKKVIADGLRREFDIEEEK